MCEIKRGPVIIPGNSLPKSMRQFAKELYQDNDHVTVKDTEFKPRNFCEVIHIGIVCSGFRSNVYVHALLKSLFLSRSNPIYFHILVSNESDTVLRLLFKTWQLHQVNVSFYNIHSWLRDVRWVPNGHYSGNYGLLKLIFNKVIPSNITTKLLILDTDIIINGDLYGLWTHFDNFNYKQALGIGENQSPYYLGTLNQAHPWPALGMGFNSGVMLQDLQKLNAMKWDVLWVNLTKRLTLLYGQTDLGDQDIINALVVENPHIVYKLPCYWNIQMSSHSTSRNCYKKFKPQILHWNSPKKFGLASNDAENFRGLANTIFELNGNWFRRYPQLCNDDTQIQLNIESSDVCQRFSKHPDVFYRTLLFFLDYKLIADDWDITYVTHLSYNRIYLMENIAKMWNGPISFTLYVSDAELAHAMKLISDSPILSLRTDIAYHAVFKQEEFYPINTLRNTGLKHVNTPFVFLVDIDFVPMKSLFKILKETIKSIGDLKKKALIVPAFEAASPNVMLPKNKIQLIEAFEKKQIRPFLAEVWEAGHAPTDYKKWQKEYEPYQVKWQVHYEPYIVVTSDVVRYDERFLGFGWNKASHTMELEAQNYDFIVLSDVFIIHELHEKSFDNMKYKKSPIYRKCVQALKRRFVLDLLRKYHRNFTDINYSEDLQKNRRKRGINVESTTTLYDSTDYFLTWGGKERAERKKEHKKKNPQPEKGDMLSHETFIEYDYYFDERPYNLTVLKIKPTETRFRHHTVNIKQVDLSSSEEHDYEYDEEDSKFKNMHDSTTEPYIGDNFTILSDADLIAHEKNFTMRGYVDEHFKNMSIT